MFVALPQYSHNTILTMKRVELEPEFELIFVPCPPEMVAAQRAGFLLLLELIRECQREMEEGNYGSSDIDHHGDGVRVGAALLPLDDVAAGQAASEAGGLYDRDAGVDGPFQRVAVDAE